MLSPNAVIDIQCDQTAMANHFQDLLSFAGLSVFDDTCQPVYRANISLGH